MNSTPAVPDVAGTQGLKAVQVSIVRVGVNISW